MKKVLPLFLALTVLLTACGAKATPTADPANVQASAVAMAFTMAAQTAAAVPTNTPVPPTETPTLTPEPSPTLPIVVPTFPTVVNQPLPTATLANAGQSPCMTPLEKNTSGQHARLQIVNENKASIQGSVCLYHDTTGFGYYGVIGVQLGPNDSTIIEVPFGCYSGYFWVTGKKPSTASNSGFCINNTDKWVMRVGATSIKFISP